jgi:hypothetical protein
MTFQYYSATYTCTECQHGHVVHGAGCPQPLLAKRG